MFGTINHEDLVAGNQHLIYRWAQATAPTPAADDVGKVWKDTDDDTLWLCTNHSPATFLAISLADDGSGNLTTPGNLNITGDMTATGNLNAQGVPVSRNLIKSVSIENPTDSEDITLFFVDEAITISQLTSVLVGSDTPSVTWTLRHDPDRSAAGTEVITDGTTTTSTSTGTQTTSFDDETIPANSWVWLETTDQSGTVGLLNISIEYHEDAL